MRRDAALHPLKGGTLTNDAPLPEFSDDELAKARSLIEEEALRCVNNPTTTRPSLKRGPNCTTRGRIFRRAMR